MTTLLKNVRNVHKHLKISHLLPIYYKYGNVRSGSSYDGPGKTVVNILNKDIESGLMIDAYSTIGFKLNNGYRILGPIIMFPRSAISWNVEEIGDLTRDAFCLFDVLEPRVDVLVIGVGDPENVAKTFSLLQLGRELKTNIEVLDTEHAIATFNFLNAERRSVAAALLPPKEINITDSDVTISKSSFDVDFSM